MNILSALRELLYKYRELYAGIADDSKSVLSVKGKWFEKICLYFLRHDRGYKDQFENVCLWSDWSERDSKPDTGIDIVAKFKDSNKFCAIQCKFYEPEYSISKPDIDTFLSASSKEIFSQRIIISTTANWNKNAEDTIQHQNPPCIRLGIDSLEQSSIDWSRFNLDNLESVSYLPSKILRSDQSEAVEAVLNGFKKHDRGKMIMACGTGKTFVSLKIAEKFAGVGKKVLFLVPSIALLNQTLLAWNVDRDKDLQMIFFAVCSDDTVGKNDDEDLKVTDLAYPATTKAEDLIGSWRFISDERKENSMTVIFSTYQSLQVINEIQSLGFPNFDLIICDEAHRTTGSTSSKDKNKEDSNFVKVHNEDFIHASKRLYMTATPKVYTEAVSKKAKDKGVEVFSMDDKNLFGEDFYTLSFSRAIQENLLSDYRVMVLAIDEKAVSEAVKDLIEKYKLDPDDATKMIGCWRGLSKQYHSSDSEFLKTDPAPMKMALAFTSTIANSKDFQKNFAEVVEHYKETYRHNDGVNCEVRHVDGSMPMEKRKREISWLKDSTDDNDCRILSNAKCLSEGIDVPALDAVLFLNPKKSKVDIVQCVGRVMRKYEGKKLGYIILPIVIPENMTPEEALDKDRNYNVIWDVLQALRSIDDKFDIEVNSIQYDKKPSKVGTGVIGRGKGDKTEDRKLTLPFSAEDWRDAVYAKIVQRCGNRQYEIQWANDMAKIVQQHTEHIKELLAKKDELRIEVFSRYINGLRTSINKNISEDEAVDMLSQHFFTKPIFDAIFQDFSKKNPVSIVIEAALEYLGANSLKDDNERLQKFYDEQRERFNNITTDAGKQQRIKDLYENFFKIALPRTSERLGIVYTPNEVVDFILQSVDWALREELHIPEGLNAKDVHILDPFTGTGTFIVRLLQLGLISPEKIKRKEVFANEILLLAYYIASVNIEMAYHALQPDSEYEPFNGICFTDTFNLATEKQEEQFHIFDENDERIKELNKTDIEVIIGNPPYSVGQKSANDNNQKIKYEELDARITETYADQCTMVNKRNLYDSYVRAIRWASDRIKERGIICFVTNGAFLDSNSADGLRKCLQEEFSKIYIFNLRGNAYLQGELRKREAGNIFGSGSRLPVAITLLIKTPIRKKLEVLYHDIGDYLKREEKLISVQREFSFGYMQAEGNLKKIIPNDKGDWINQRSEIFSSFLRLGNKKEKDEFAIFEERYSAGIITARDAWCYNFSREALKTNMTFMIEVYNQEREKWHNNKRKSENSQSFITMDSRKISWDINLSKYLKKDIDLKFNIDSMRMSLYRPYAKSNVYFNHYLNNSVFRLFSMFPTAKAKNLLIIASGIGASKDFSVLMTDCTPEYKVMFNGQCFPMYWYEESQDKQGRLFEDNVPKFTKHEAISNKALSMFQDRYRDYDITKEDIFYYIYGVLSSHEYRERFGDDVKKMLARVPLAKDFRTFSEAGRKLGNLHVNYESVEPMEGLIIEEKFPIFTEQDAEYYRVKKMKIISASKEKFIQYNDKITIKGIPSEAWEYTVNGKSALEWIVERYQDSTDKDSGLRNDCNAWSIEHGNPRYVLELIERVVRVSVESVKIVKALPELGI